MYLYCTLLLYILTKKKKHTYKANTYTRLGNLDYDKK
jgi:hypothetical protein